MSLSLAFRLKSILGLLESKLTQRSQSSCELVVLNLHSTPHNRIGDFERMLHWMKKEYTAFHPDHLEAYFAGRISSFNKGPYILFTFDDGLKNNFTTAKILSQHGLSAIYFVVPDFIDAIDPIDYYRAHIRPDIDPFVDTQPEDFTPMSWSELNELQMMGHHIGSHTKTHRLWHTMTTEESLDEVRLSQQIIEEHLGIRSPYFCSPNNSLMSVSADIQQQIMSNYRFHFTTLPGKNADQGKAGMILRRNIEVHWPEGAQRYAIGSWDLMRWRGKIQQFQTRL